MDVCIVLQLCDKLCHDAETETKTKTIADQFVS